MEQEANVIFELDLPTGQVIFHQTSSWSQILDKQVETPYDYQELADHCISRFVEPNYRAAFSGALHLSSLRSAHRKKQPLQVLEGLILNVTTSTYEWYHINLVISINGKCFGTIQNMQEEKARVELLQHNASHDVLTDLYNRETFYRHVNTLFEHASCTGAFFILDIDDFKTVNDTAGHQTGDEVIVELARLLQEHMPPDSVIGRFGGDEFTIFVPGSSDPEEYRRLAQTLCAAARQCWTPLGIGISVGIALYPTQATTIEALLGLADRALYFVKNNGKNGSAVFSSSMPVLDVPTLTTTQNPTRKRTAINWHRFGSIAAALLLLLTVLGLLSRMYYTSLLKMIQTESSEYLMEISRQISSGITDKLETTLSYLEAMGDLFPHGDTATMEDLSTLLENQCQKLGMDTLVPIDDHGNEYWDSKPVYHVALQEHITRVLLDKESFMTDTIHIDGTDYVLFFVPITPIQIQDTRISALAAFVNMEDMNTMLSLTAFDNAAFAEIINMNGAVVVRSDHPDSLLEGYNLFTCFEQETFSKHYSVEKLQSDFNNATNGVTRYILGGEEYVSYYSRLAGHNWMLFCTTPASILEAKSSTFIRITLFTCAFVALLIAGLMSFILILQLFSKRRLELVAYTDRVTLGSNREKFVKDVQTFLPRSHSSSVMLYANVEHFKLINDRFGSEEADKLLKYIFQIYNSELEAGEFVARLSGDHYALLLRDMSDQLLEARARSWNRKISLYPVLQTAGFTITVTYGAYRIENSSMSADVIIDRANMARKGGSARHGGSCIFFYDTSLQETMQWEQELENTMEQALDDGEFQMYLQPKCMAADGMVAGFEALVRWIRPDGSFITPDRFIPFFEKNGFIIRLDHYIFEQACHALAEQQTQGISPVPISVNVSRAHLMGQDLLTPYIEIWRRYQIPAALLELEFTESTIYDNTDQLQHVVEHIHQIGFTCSIDDFGSGYSSLNMLNLTNMDVVKIDRGFLGTGPDVSERSRNIIQSIIQLSHKVGMKVVTEGVESRQQADFLHSCGCDYFQGYYFGRPQPAKEALLHTNKILPED